MRRSSYVATTLVAATLAVGGLACDGGFRGAGSGVFNSAADGRGGAALNAPWNPIDAGCPPVDGSPNVTDPDAGNPIWKCVRAMCQTELASCGADCECNNLILTALSCANEAGAVDECFGTHAFTALGSQWSELFSCVSISGIECVQSDGAVEDVSQE
jgi:hypothetical protein